MNTQGLLPVILILGLNGLLAIIIFLMSFFKKMCDRSTMIMLSWFIFIVPLAGIIYILVGLFINKITHNTNVDMNDVSFNQDREKIILPPNQEIEMNYVPIQDAVAISDRLSLRKLLLDTMLVKTRRKISNIAAAMDSNDTEASHYVATMIMDVLAELRSTSQEMLVDMLKVPEDVEKNLLAFDYIYEFLSLKILSEIEQETYIYELNNVAENLFKYNLWYMTATHYLRMTDMFISIKNYNMADKWSRRAEQYRPNMLDTYKAKLHLYFEQGNYDFFLQCLDELKRSDIDVDREIMNLFKTYYDYN